MAKPNFFVVGAPKCGTSALSIYLKGHPNIFLSEPKELFYFDRDLSKRDKLDEESYLSLFSKANPDIHKVIGEASTSYLFSKVAVSEILKFNPDAKFLVMLRNPVDIAQAWHSQKTWEGTENILGFEDAWRAEKDRVAGRRIPAACWEVKQLLYSEWAKLGDQMERLFSLVARSKIKVVIFDDFVADPKRSYDEVLAFLEVPPDGRTEFPKINENKKVHWPWFQQWVALGLVKWFQLKDRLGLKLQLGIARRLIYLNSKPTKRESLSDEFRMELKAFYRDDVMRLSKILGRDLSNWVSNSPNDE